jgi:hypothetical protein
LLGDSTFTLPPKSNKLPYELIYSPLKVGEFIGSISFKAPRSGQFWYKVNLIAKEGSAIPVEPMECMIGSNISTRVTVENPLDEQVTFTVSLSGEAFHVVQESIRLPPYAQSYFILTYRPTALNTIEACVIELTHPKFGQIKYSATGKGLLPGNMPPVEIASPVGVLGSYNIQFSNPFNYALPVDVVLSAGEEDSDAFELLLRKASGIVVGSLAVLRIGVSFTPSSLRAYAASVQVRALMEGGRTLLWCYPLSGLADAAGQPLHLIPLSTPCKTSMTRDIEIKLQGLRTADLIHLPVLSLASLSLEVVAEPQYKAVIARALRIQPVELVRLYDDVTAEYAVKYRVLFEPLKEFSSQVILTVTGKNIGRWRADMDVESTAPAPDDVIRLQAAVGSSDSVSFKLNNRWGKYSNMFTFVPVYFGLMRL